jgi:hypothetical protein
MTETEGDGSAGPVFVVGTMRSGSTLLRLLLDSHPNIAIGEETGFMGGLAAARVIPGWRYGEEWHRRIGWTDAERDARLREFYSGMFARHAASQGKTRWGEKTPFHSWHVPDMARVFPDAVFLAIVRHPGAVVWSLKNRFHYSVPDAAAYWAATNVELVRRGVELSGARFAMCRYEDIVGDTDQTMRDVFRWLGEPWSEDVMRHHEVQAGKGAPRLVDGNTSTRTPVRTDRVTPWVGHLTAEERAELTTSTNDLAHFLGYDAEDPDALLAWDANGGFQRLLTGDDLGERQRAWIGRVAFDAPQQTSVVADMTMEDMARRVQRAEAALQRIRSRPVVRASEAIRRAQRRHALHLPIELGALLRGASARRRRGR